MGWLKGLLKKRIIWLKIDLPAFMAFVLFAGLIFFYLIPGFEKVMMDRKRTMLQEISSSVYSLLVHFNAMEQNGELSKAEAQEIARSSIGSIRYGTDGKDYFWITDMTPVMIEHPYRSDLNGKDLTDFRDSKGKPVFVEFVRAVSLTGESYVDYMWQWNDDSTRIVPKLSYVRLFRPWGWIIGTGIYIEDVRSEIRRIENRAMLISGVIALVIIILLAAITRQSHRIELRRKKTEEDLIRSRELYRTLAEAATEGVLIWSENGIQANKTLLSWIGISEDEIMKLKVTDILSSDDIEEGAESSGLFEMLLKGKFGECELKCKNGNVIKAHSDFSGILMGEKKAVMGVIRPVKHSSPDNLFALPAGLIDSISTGFFRLSLGRKNRFLMASDPTLKILGFDNLADLITHPVESFLISPGQLSLIKKRLINEEAVVNMTLAMKDRNGSPFQGMVSVVVVQQKYPGLWCDGTVEYLSPADNAEPGLDPVPARYFWSYLMEAPVTTIMKTLPEYHVEATSQYISRDRSVAFAYDLLSSSVGSSLLVTSDEGTVTGIITAADIFSSLNMPRKIIADEINVASGGSDLRKVYLKMQDIAISMILAKADPLRVSSFISSIADLICDRALILSIAEAGRPPCSFAFIQTGSAGRMEQTLLTDQDNAIIFEDCDDNILPEAEKYFTALGKKVNKILAEAGYKECRGNNMAGNPLWSQPLKVWKRYFSEWIRIPDPHNLLEISIFFDFRHCYGDAHLTESLREYVMNDLTTSDIFFHHMASAWKNLSPSAGILEYEKADIKKILMPLTGLVRLYSLRHGIKAYSTSSRLVALYEANHFKVTLMKECLRALKDLSSLRLSGQASCLSAGREADNFLDLKGADPGYLYRLNMAIRSVNELMLKAGNDFYTTDI